jgi:hypothetical protein
LHAQTVLVLALGLALNPSRVPNVAEQVKFAVFAKACSAKWSPQVHVVVVAVWAQSLLRHVQSVLAKVAHHHVSHTPLMYLVVSILARQCDSLVVALQVHVAAMQVICTCMLQLLNTRDLFEKMMTLFVTFH